jgi:hypothetical protein
LEELTRRHRAGRRGYWRRMRFSLLLSFVVVRQKKVGIGRGNLDGTHPWKGAAG